jgi:cytochrome c-type biogenesis protein CcmE
MKAKYIIGVTIIVLFMVWGASAFFSSTVKYVSINEARNSQRTVQVMGKIDFEKVNYNASANRLEFTIYDAEAAEMAGASSMQILYNGVIPGNFDQAKSIVCKGKSDGNVFVADQLLVKCPSKYQGEGDEEYQDMNKDQRVPATTSPS